MIINKWTPRAASRLTRHRVAAAVILLGSGALASPGAVSAYSVTEDGAYYTVTAANVGGFVYDFTYLADFTSFTNANRTYISGINFKVDGGPALVSASLLSGPGGAGLWTTTINDNLSGSNIGCEGGNGNSGFVCSGITLEANYALAPTLPNDPAAGPVYSWLVRVTFNSLLTEAMITNSKNPIRAQFIRQQCKNSNNNNESNKNKENKSRLKNSSPTSPPTCELEWKGAGQMSLNGPFVCAPGTCIPEDKVPEPGSLALLGLGLLGLGIARRFPARIRAAV